jgi:hypothetical protein
VNIRSPIIGDINIREDAKMIEGFFLKMFGAMFYLIVAGWGMYGIVGAVRQYRAIGRAALKTQGTLYELQKLIESRGDMNKA